MNAERGVHAPFMFKCRSATGGQRAAPGTLDFGTRGIAIVRYVYGITSALLVGGTALALVTQSPVGAQVAQNEQSEIAKVVPRSGAPESFADLVEQLQPAVVNISTKQEVTLGVRLNPFAGTRERSEEHTSELQSLMRISYAVFCLTQT